MRRVSYYLLVVVAMGLIGCTRGTTSDQPPIHLNPNMDHQEKYKAYDASPFFEDGKTMRPRIPGTVARGELDMHAAIPPKNPLPLTEKNLRRGQERFGIYCSPCHGAVGDGQGMVAKRGIPRGLVPPTSFHSDFLRNQTDGHFFDVMTNGIRNMEPYRHQISQDDRWRIVQYVRALQRSQYAKRDDVPKDVRGRL